MSTDRSRLSPATILALRAQAQADLRAGRLRNAEHALQLVLRDLPYDEESLYLLGLVALQAGNGSVAADLLLPLAAKQTGSAAVQYNAALALVMRERFGEAARFFRRALDLDPGLAPAWHNLGNVLKTFGEVDQAYECFERAVALSPEDSVRQSHQLICSHYCRNLSHDQIYELHLRWAKTNAAQWYPRAKRIIHDPDPERLLRVGLVSPSFNKAVVGHFLHGVLPGLRFHRIKLFAYSAAAHEDEITSRLRESIDEWRNISQDDDDTAASRIVSDRIDLLVDLAGHVPGNRLLVFARKPAPVQVTWLDYFDTTGLATIDYLITDTRTTPAQTGQRFSERLIYLPESRLCWTPPEFAPDVAVPPSLHKGIVTFGSFNRAEKLHPDLLVLWAEILRRVPGSRLLLKNVAFAMPEIRRHFGERFSVLGVSPERIVWRGASDHEQLLAEYADIDIALDTSPYNGGATTCDALWMGVPVIALREERMIGRQSAAILDCIGLGELVAGTPSDYVNFAVELANDPARLKAVRTGLRPAMAGSPLCDPPRFARDLAEALRGVWRNRCQEVLSTEEQVR